MNGWKHYVNAANYGQTKWYHWVGGFWLALIGTLVAQGLLTKPTYTLIAKADPELYAQIYTASQANLAVLEDMSFKIISGMSFLFALLATGLWCASWIGQDRKTSTKIGLLALFCSILSIICVNYINASLDSSVLQGLLLKSIGLNPIIYLLTLLTYPLTLSAFYIVQKLWYKRTIKSLHTAFARFNWKRGFFAMGAIPL